jgi:hypothetical protein
VPRAEQVPVGRDQEARARDEEALLLEQLAPDGPTRRLDGGPRATRDVLGLVGATDFSSSTASDMSLSSVLGDGRFGGRR